MGLYDTMENGEQVKCFYFIGFWKDGYTAERNGGFGDTTHIGGNLRYFPVGNKLPIKTKYYNYPVDFCIFDYRFFESDYFEEGEIAVHIVRNGVYERFVLPGEITDKDILPYWIGSYGQPINIRCKEDVVQIQKDFKSYTEQRASILIKHGSMKLLNKARDCVNDKVKFDEIMQEYDRVTKEEIAEISKITVMNKWICPDPFKDEKQLGEYWEVIANESREKDYNKCKKAFKHFLEANEGVIERYIEWQNLSSDEVDVLNAVIKTVIGQ